MSNVSIPEFVESLDYDQLKRLLELATAKKEQRDGETKLWVHQISIGDSLKNFRSDDFIGMADFFHTKLTALQESDEELEDKIYTARTIRVNSFKERTSEYESWFG